MGIRLRPDAGQLMTDEVGAGGTRRVGVHGQASSAAGIGVREFAVRMPADLSHFALGSPGRGLDAKADGPSAGCLAAMRETWGAGG